MIGEAESPKILYIHMQIEARDRAKLHTENNDGPAARAPLITTRIEENFLGGAGLVAQTKKYVWIIVFGVGTFTCSCGHPFV